MSSGLELGIVRASSYRNVFGKTNAKNSWHENLKVGTVKTSLYEIKCNSKFFAFPWKTASVGSLAVKNLQQYGKFSELPPLIEGHKSFINDFEFYPFDDMKLVTSSLDGMIKLWKLDDLEMGLSKTMDNELLTFDVQSYNSNACIRIGFHPSVSDLMITAHRDKCVRLWNIETNKQFTCIGQDKENNTGEVLNFSWSHDGSTLCTGGKDKKFRIFDPRSKTSEIIQVEAHPNPKGVQANWLGAKPYITSVGFSKQGERQFCIWDLRKLNDSAKVNTTTLDNGSALVLPFFDNANNLLFLAGKGDGIVRYYEIVYEEPYVHFINEYKGTSVQSSLFPFPKTSCNVMECEIMKFLKLTAANTVETLSFYVPRKTTHLFQEDIFPPAFCGEPFLSFDEYFVHEKNAENGPKTISLHPEGIKSIYEVSEQEGGKMKISKSQKGKSSAGLDNGDVNNQNSGVGDEVDDDEGTDYNFESDEEGVEIEVDVDESRTNETNMVGNSSGETSNPTISIDIPSQDQEEAGNIQKGNDDIIQVIQTLDDVKIIDPYFVTSVAKTDQTEDIDNKTDYKEIEIKIPTVSSSSSSSNIPEKETQTKEINRQRMMSMRRSRRMTNNPTPPHLINNTSEVQNTTLQPVEKEKTSNSEQKSSVSITIDNQHKENDDLKKMSEKNKAVAKRFQGYLWKKNPSGIGWKKRWFSLERNTLFYFEKDSSSNSLGSIPVNQITNIQIFNKTKSSFQFNYLSRIFFLAAENNEIRDNWIKKLKKRSSFLSQEGVQELTNHADASASIKLSPRGQYVVSAIASEEDNELKGMLYKKNPSGNGWKRRWFEYNPEDNILSYSLNPNTNALGNIHLSRVIGVCDAPGKIAKKQCTNLVFQIATPSRTYYLMTESEKEKNRWVNALNKEVNFLQDLSNQTAGMDEDDDDAQDANTKQNGDQLIDKQHTPDESIAASNDSQGNIEQALSDYLLLVDERDPSSVRRRWVMYEEPKSALCLYVTKSNPEQKILIHEMKFIGSLSDEDIRRMKLNMRDASTYFKIETNRQDITSMYFIAGSESMKKTWVDGLNIVKQTLDVTDDSKVDAVEMKPKQIDNHDILTVTPPQDAELSTKNSQEQMIRKRQMSTRKSRIQRVSMIAPNQPSMTNTLPTTNTTTDAIIDDTSSTSIVSEKQSEQNTQVKKSDNEEETKKKKKIKVDVLTSLGIEDENQKADKNVPQIDLTLVKNGKQKILIEIFGKKWIHVRQVEFHARAMNRKLVYILDCGNVIYQWNGRNANRLLKAKGLEISSTIKFKERSGTAEVIIINDGSSDSDEVKLEKQFWKEFENSSSGTQSDVSSSDSIDEDVKIKLYRISKSKERKKKVTLVSFEGTLPLKEQLNSKFVYVLDSVYEIFVWVGKSSALIQRRLAMLVASVLIKQQDRKQWVSITRLVENGENILWKEKFLGYPGILPIHTGTQETQGNVAQKREQEKIDVKELYVKKAPSPKVIGDKGNGVIQIWVVKNFQREEYAKELYGQFFSAESYIVLYTYQLEDQGHDHHIIYYWQGRDAGKKEKGTSALLTINLDETLGGDAEQVRVLQNSEPEHFLSLFKNKFIIHKGSSEQFYTTENTRLYQIRGETDIDTRAVEVECNSSFLNSNYVFLKVSKDQSYLWIGKCSLKHERDIGERLASIIIGNDDDEDEKNKENSLQSLKTIQEGQEPSDFWKYLTGGKTNQYSQYSHFPAMQHTHVPRLFCCSFIDVFTVEEIYHFNQDDLYIGNSSNCFILDCKYVVFVWISKFSSERTRQWSLKIGKEYAEMLKKESLQEMKGETQKKPQEMPDICFALLQNNEPYQFTNQFRGWSNTSKVRLSTIRRQSVTLSSTVRRISIGGLVQQSPLIPASKLLERYSQKLVVPYERLLQDPLPEGVDKSKLETYLSEEEFSQLFDMTVEEFSRLPSWKKNSLKQKVYLF